MSKFAVFEWAIAYVSVNVDHIRDYFMKFTFSVLEFSLSFFSWKILWHLSGSVKMFLRVCCTNQWKIFHCSYHYQSQVQVSNHSVLYFQRYKAKTSHECCTYPLRLVILQRCKRSSLNARFSAILLDSYTYARSIYICFICNISLY